MLAAFAALAPFAATPLAPLRAFNPISQSVLAVLALITAVLLFGQFCSVRNQALRTLASGYLFLACMIALQFNAPAPRAAWWFALTHGGFALFALIYATRSNTTPADPARRALWAHVATVVAAACVLALVATAGADMLPVYSNAGAAMRTVAGGVGMLSLAAVLALWRRRPRSVLDVGLMVALCALIFNATLSAVLSGGDFDAGFYAGRIYGVLAASAVLAVLLFENKLLYAQARAAHEHARADAHTLAHAAQELEALSYSVSHDLRAPLRAVGGYAKMLEEDYVGKLGADGDRLLRLVRERSERMDQMIDNLLAYSRLARQPLQLQSVSLDELVAQALGELGTARDISRVAISIGTLGTVRADPALLKRLLTNLLDNAVKFTRTRDLPRIEIGRRGAGAAAVYYIKDNGAGFDMHYADKLFGVFQRFHRADDYEGNGIGLAIAQRIVARHGGRIWGESTPADGTAFYFTLPQDGAPSTAPAA